MTLFLLKNVKLTPEYKDVFRTRDLMNRYWQNECESVAIVTGEWYWDLEGDFRMQLPDFLAYPNYAVIVDNDGTIKYFFITNFNIKNGIQTFHYSCDIWHTYAILDNASLEYSEFTFSIQNGVRTLSNLTDAPVRTPITQPKYWGPAIVEPYSMDDTTPGHYAILYTGYTYTGVTDMQGPSNAQPFMGYVLQIGIPTGVSSVTHISTSNMQNYLHAMYGVQYIMQFGTYTRAAKFASQLFTSCAAGSWVNSNGKDVYAQISHCYIVPYSFVSQLANAENPCDNWIVGGNSSEYYDYCALYRVTGVSSTYDGLAIAPFLTDMPSDKNGAQYDNALSTTYTATHAFSAGFSSIGRRVSYGTMQHLIDVPYAGIGENIQEINSIVYFSTANIGIKFSTFGEQIDISNDFEYEINYTPESALTAVQRENLVKSDTIGLVTSTIGGVVQSTLGVLTGNVAGAIGGVANIGTSIANYAVAREREYSTVTAAPASNSTMTQYYGLCTINYALQNADEIENDYQRFGARVHVIEDEITLSDEIISGGQVTSYPYRYTVVCYEDTNVYGSAPGNVLERIRQILIDGTRIWNETFGGYDKDGKLIELKLPKVENV